MGANRVKGAMTTEVDASPHTHSHLRFAPGAGGQRDRAMTAMELAFALLALLCAIIAARIAFHAWGTWAAVVAALLGLFIPACLGAVVLRIDRFFRNRRPPRPMCETGRCRWDQYSVSGFSGSDTIFVCECGAKYMRSGRQFYRILEDGQRRPYMILDEVRRWQPDPDAGK